VNVHGKHDHGDPRVPRTSPRARFVSAPRVASSKGRTLEMKEKKNGIHLLAELANVSIGTVDRALHARVVRCQGRRPHWGVHTSRDPLFL